MIELCNDAPGETMYANEFRTARQQAPKMMRPEQVEIEDLNKIGPVVITVCGDENLYFIFTSGTRKGYRGYCKCL